MTKAGQFKINNRQNIIARSDRIEFSSLGLLIMAINMETVDTRTEYYTLLPKIFGVAERLAHISNVH